MAMFEPHYVPQLCQLTIVLMHCRIIVPWSFMAKPAIGGLCSEVNSWILKGYDITNYIFFKHSRPFFFSSFKCGNGSRITKTHIQNIRSVEGLKEVHKKYCRVHIVPTGYKGTYSKRVSNSCSNFDLKMRKFLVNCVWRLCNW